MMSRGVTVWQPRDIVSNRTSHITNWIHGTSSHITNLPRDIVHTDIPYNERVTALPTKTAYIGFRDSKILAPTMPGEQKILQNLLQRGVKIFKEYYEHNEYYDYCPETRDLSSLSNCYCLKTRLFFCGWMNSSMIPPTMEFNRVFTASRLLVW